MNLMIPTLAVAATVAAHDAPKATQPFRDEHALLHQHLEQVRASVGALPSRKPDEQRNSALDVVAFFEKQIAPHAAWEERSLYPLVDRLAGGGRNPFTASMRYEHTVVARWIGELKAMTQQPHPDWRAFCRRADNLLGLVDAHFEEEEQVLLPLIDQSMTREQFEKEVGGLD